MAPGFVDLHCHLLPGIDDGAPDLETALELARIAVEDGITHAVCSPHIHIGRFDNTKQTIGQALTVFREGLEEANIPLVVSSSAEIRFDLDIMRMFTADEIPYVGQWQGKHVLLLEFPHGEMPVGALQLVKWLISRDVVPLIAHPERNKAIMRDPKMIKPFVQAGCLLQVTASSVAGGFGQGAQDAAHYFLSEDLVTILGSDAHNVEHRPPVVSEGMDAAAKLVGEQAARSLLIDRPWEIARGHFEH